MWRDLTMAQKAEVMKEVVRAGYRNIDDIRNFYDTSIKEFSSGGSIHIDPSKRGTFTAAATKHGMGVQEFASQVLSNKEDYSPAMVKKANFARNASHWHDIGGELEDLESKIYEANSIEPGVVVTAQAPTAYWDGFNWIGYNSLGQRTIKGDNFRPEGAHIITNPQDFERARLRQAKIADVDHTHAFVDNMRKFATGVAALPMATTLAGPAISGITKGGDALANAYFKINPAIRKPIEGVANAAFAAEGLHNYLGKEGYQKTDRLLSEGKYGQAAKSFLGDALDISMALPYANAVVQESKNIIPTMDGITDFYRHNIRNPYRKIRKIHNAPKRSSDLGNAVWEHYQRMQDDISRDLNGVADEWLANLDKYNRLSREARRYQFLDPVFDGDIIAQRLPKYIRNSNTEDVRTNIASIGERATPEQIKGLFDKYPSLQKEGLVYNPTEKRFEIIQSTSPFDARRNDIVKTGNITLTDIANNKEVPFFLDPMKLIPNSGKQVYELGSQPIGVLSRKRNKVLKGIESFIYKPQITEGAPIPTPELPEGYADLINSNIKEITENILPGSKVFGSSANVARGNLYHDAHDIDVIMTQKQAMAHPEYKNWVQSSPATWVYNHPTAGPLDVNILKENNEGYAIGDRAHELYAQLFPKEYSQLMRGELSKNDYNQWAGRDVLDHIALDKTPEELLEAYDPVAKSIADAFSSRKDKHIGRAQYLLHYGNVGVVKKGFETYANYLTGGNYTPSVPVEAFNDAKKNSEWIDKFIDIPGINKEQFINDPERMSLLWEYNALHKKFLGRGIDSRESEQYGNTLFDSLLKWFEDTEGGTARGVGLNTILGGNSGYGNIYESILPDNLSKVTGKNPEEMMANLNKVLGGNAPLSAENLTRIQEIATKNGITIRGNSLQEILDSTSGRRGIGYKNFLKELKEEFGVDAITNRDFLNAGTYASSTADLEPSNIGQIFVGLDRPMDPKAKAASVFSKASSASAEDAKNFLKRAEQTIKSRHDEAISSNTEPYMYSLEQRVEAHKAKASADNDAKRKALNEKRQEVYDRNAATMTKLRNLDVQYAVAKNKLLNVGTWIAGSAGVGAMGTAMYSFHKKQKQESLEKKARLKKQLEEKAKNEKEYKEWRESIRKTMYAPPIE